MFDGDFLNEASIGPYRPDLLSVAYNARVCCDLIPCLGWQAKNGIEIKTVEHFLKTGPFLVDDQPDKTRLKQAAGHLCQKAAGILEGKFLRRGDGGQQQFEYGFPTFSFSGPMADSIKGVHSSELPGGDQERGLRNIAEYRRIVSHLGQQQAAFHESKDVFCTLHAGVGLAD